MATNNGPIMSQFPQPTRPLDSLSPVSSSTTVASTSTININDFSQHFPDQFDNNNNIPQNYPTRESSGEEDTIEVDDDLFQFFTDEFNGKGREILNKILSKMEKNVELNRGIIRKKLDEFKDELAPDLFEKLRRKLNKKQSSSVIITQQRGVEEEQQEIKLERFRVKLPAGVVIVKEEEDDKKN
ncbi:hypothetical protein M9H77_24140 [Catharanthus roseus]|uniref:Uncharacterized protein n=1 Tax=Catharanthus roseus TaxID=4058 RepID=A0ACC0AXW4_CATRO|nr:hypothetical protein M9H77_24140 [Catharanthus roseus]